MQFKNSDDQSLPFRRTGGGLCTGSGALPLVNGEAEELLLVVLQEGTAVVEYCSARFPYSTGELLCVPFGHRVALRSSDSFTCSYMSCIGMDMPSSITGPAIAAVGSKWAESFALACAGKGERDIFDTISKGIPVLERLGEEEKVVPPWLLRCKQTLDTFPQESVSLERMERELGVSRFRIIREFRLRWNTTPMEYLSERRLCEAQKLLLGGGATITAIAEEVGYSSAPYFIQCFKKRFGTTPAAYREANRD